MNASAPAPKLDWKLARSLAAAGRWRKLLNYAVATVQFARRSTFLWAYPYQLYLDPSSRCTLRCPYCAVGSRQYPKPMKDMSLDDFKAVMDELGPYLLLADLFVKGEPFMNPHMLDMVALCKKYGVYTRTSSNMQDLDEGSAVRLVESGLDYLMAAVDGVRQETYEKYRVAGNLEKAFQNIRRVVEAKKRLGRKTPVVEWKFIVFRHNERELEEAKRKAAELGVDRLAFVMASVGEPPLEEKDRAWVPLDPKYSMYDPEAKAVVRTVSGGGLMPACNLPWVSLTLDPGLGVQTCCRPVRREEDHGVFGRGFFWSVWNGGKFRKSRAYVREGYAAGDRLNLCSGCTAGASLSVRLPKEGLGG